MVKHPLALLMLCQPGSATVLWAATVGAGLGVCALYSNVVSLLAYAEKNRYHRL